MSTRRGSTPVINVWFQNHYKQSDWPAGRNNEDWRQPSPIMERNNILYCKSSVSNQLMASEFFRTKATQQCDKYLQKLLWGNAHADSLFRGYNVKYLVFAGVMETRRPSKYWLNMLMLSDNDTKRTVDIKCGQRRPANRALQWHLSSPDHCEPRQWTNSMTPTGKWGCLSRGGDYLVTQSFADS